MIYPNESVVLDARLTDILPRLRPAARDLVRNRGFLSRRRKRGLPMARVSKGWCVFFNSGCVLHKIGAEQGDPFRFKPAACSLFPLSKDEHDRWYIRQKGYQGEIWDLPCLDAAISRTPAVESLTAEIRLAESFTKSEP